MARLKVLTYPDPFLKTHAEEVTLFDDELLKLLQDMAETMYEAPGIGLAATQVGSSKNLFVMDIHYHKDDPSTQKNPLFIINPKIVQSQGDTIMEEGCLSVPEFQAEVKRALRVTLEYQNEKGEPQRMEAEGLEAVCIQHEMDHLKGILFIDYLSSLRRKMVQTRLKKLARV